jgi:Limiting CO2-inducible proteins B/C beta carbonyic anhydrases
MKKKDKLEIVKQHYPTAMTTLDTVNKMLTMFEEQYDLEARQIMLADSICSDDVNSMEYPASARNMLGPFKMGGLNGFPFTGLTGMGAFAAHVPENGAVFIYYAPHIGISKHGNLGEINRVGQSKPSGCCGAARAALNKLINNQIEPGKITELDYQMNYIEQLFYKQKERILQSAQPLKEATEVMYEAIDDRILQLVQLTKYNCRFVIIMGAILINGDYDMGSFSVCKRFEITDLNTKQKTDLSAQLLLPGILL